MYTRTRSPANWWPYTVSPDGAFLCARAHMTRTKTISAKCLFRGLELCFYAARVVLKLSFVKRYVGTIEKEKMKTCDTREDKTTENRSETIIYTQRALLCSSRHK